MKNDHLDAYELFYLEIPRTEADLLNDISNDIQVEHDAPNYSDFQGLSDEQVSEIARDSLGNIDGSSTPSSEQSDSRSQDSSQS